VDLDELRKKMTSFVDRVFDRQVGKGVKKKKERGREKILVVYKGKEAEWRVRPSNDADIPADRQSTFFLTRQRLVKWIKFLTENLFVMVGNRNMQQVIGIPMGTNCAPFLANILLYMYELEFFEKFVQENDVVNDENAKDFMRRMSYCTRYIDDLWNPAVAGATFQQATVQMYPDWLKLGDPEDEGADVNYLDMNIWNEGDRWHSRLYDKRVGLVKKGLKLNKFPHPTSKLSVRCKLGIITSQLHRFEVACTKTKDFMKAAVRLYTEFIKKGYSSKMVNSYCKKFILRSKIGRSLHPNAIPRWYRWLHTKHRTSINWKRVVDKNTPPVQQQLLGSYSILQQPPLPTYPRSKPPPLPCYPPRPPAFVIPHPMPTPVMPDTLSGVTPSQPIHCAYVPPSVPTAMSIHPPRSSIGSRQDRLRSMAPYHRGLPRRRLHADFDSDLNHTPGNVNANDPGDHQSLPQVFAAISRGMFQL